MIDVLLSKQEQLWRWYNNVWLHRDKRVDGYFLMSSPLPTVAICFTYIYLVKITGPNYMRDKKPWEIRKFMILYNAFQVLFNLCLFLTMFRAWVTYDMRCQPVDYTTTPAALLQMNACYFYYLSKFIDFIDTFCFIVRKKFHQVSFLHVVHHSILPMSVWPGMRWFPGGHGSFFGLLNTFVHIVMYFYYMMSALGPQYQKYCWWKKYLTKLQMVQFIVIMVHGFQLLFRPDCKFPVAFAYYIGAHAILFFVLFMQFYIRAYVTAATCTGTGSKGKVNINGYDKITTNGVLNTLHGKNRTCSTEESVDKSRKDQ